MIRNASKGHWLQSRPCEERFKIHGRSMGHQGVMDDYLKRWRCLKNQTRRIKRQKAMEVNGGQHKGMVVAVRRAMPKGHRACPVRCCLPKGISPL